MYEWTKQNLGRYYIPIIFIVLVLVFYWLYCDTHRNDKDYNNTDGTVAELNQRISSLEQRLDTMSERIEETQKTVNGIAVGITRSTGYAIEVNEGLGRAEERLDNAIQRSGRIENLIKDVERTNK